MPDFMNIHMPGIGNASSYQVAGRPFVTGNLSVPTSSAAPLRIDFPSVTKNITLSNQSNVDVRVGFSENGIKGTNFVVLHDKNQNPILQLGVKVTSIFLLSTAGATTVSLSAELTNIPASEILNNWSGSAGVG